MWRPAIALIAVATLAGAALAIRSSVSTDAIRAVAERRLSDWADRPIRLSGRPEIRLIPTPHVRYSDVVVTAADAPVARAETIDVHLRLAALLLGSIEPGTVAVTRPRLDLDAPSGTNPVEAAIRRLAAAPLGRITIDGGEIRLKRPEGVEETIGIDEIVVERADPTSGVAVDAELSWHGRPLRAVLGWPTAVDPGTATGPSSLTLTAPGLRVGFSGTTEASGRVSGSLEAGLDDPGAFVRWTGADLDPALFDGPLGLDGRLEVAGSTATLSTARLDLAGDRGEGVLSLRLEGERPQLAGTLAFDTIDLTGERRRALGPGLPAVRLDRIASPVDLDLRLSAARLVTSGLALDRVAASLSAIDGRLLIELGNADLWSTPASALLKGRLAGDGLEAQIRGSVADLPIAAALASMRVTGIEAGRATVGGEADLRCRRLGDCLASLTGRLKIDARGLRATSASPFADAGRFAPTVVKAVGSTSIATWDRLEADLRFAGRHADLDRLEIDGHGPRFSLTGTGDLLSGAIDLTGTAVFPIGRADPARANEASTILIRVEGTIRRPDVRPRNAAPPVGDAPRP
jgi:AsmA protein